jgi:hypothetical protein
MPHLESNFVDYFVWCVSHVLVYLKGNIFEVFGQGKGAEL